MKKKNVKKIAVAVVLGLMLPMAANAEDSDLQLKVDKLTKEVNDLKGTVKKVERDTLGKWLSIDGEYRFRVDSLKGKTVAYSDAIDTMMKMVKGFTAPVTGLPGSGVAGGTIGGITSPTPSQFMMEGKSGVLFTPTQFSTILTEYMPQAMYSAFGTPTTGIAGAVFAATGAGTLDTMIAGTKLTAQQSAILNTLSQKVMPIVMDMPAPAAFGAPVGTTMGDLFAGMNDKQKLLANQMLMQGFLGANGAYLKQVASYKPENETLYTNKFGLNLTAKPIKDITVHASLGIYKAFGSQSDSTTTGNFFADRVGAFDGTIGHIPTDSKLNVDRAYATWSNIADEPLWFSVGRRPSTNGAPSNLRLNHARPGNGGTPALLVDYAFDGMTVGYAPDIEPLPGAYAKICYGRGFESGTMTQSNGIDDTDMLGVALIPIDTDPLRVWMQWNRGFEIFDFPAMNNTIFGNTAPAVSLGDIDWYGAGAMSTLKNIGPGTLQLFGDLGLSITHPNGNVSQNAGFQGLLSGEFFAQDFAPKDQTGWAGYAGIRYDLPSNTKIGFEFNHGSKYWITFAPSADDMWTSKLGTRGNVYEPYVIQELNLKPISSYFAKAFFKLGYQYYDFEYTGSNNWVGAPKKISDISSSDLMLMAPVKSASNIYGTFEVQF
ncbi:MAG: DUF3373 domain-containing protein [Desulfuromonadaceae bacterium]|nr:DUF3373 domain-containing protein [Desulfuromonadaceae bacterium]MDD2854850.1 DUF3373 domain-containing protein [Desulfuromonadaceae bacterium]